METVILWVLVCLCVGLLGWMTGREYQRLKKEKQAVKILNVLEPFEISKAGEQVVLNHIKQKTLQQVRESLDNGQKLKTDFSKVFKAATIKKTRLL